MENTSIDDNYYYPEVRDGFRIAGMTKRYWAVQMKVLSEIDAVCARHGIRWFAEFGTLLGAVRHKGFIPWDDDMDITMFREDYESFLKVAPEELPGTYKVFDVKLNQGYDDPLGRIVNNGRIQFDPAFMAEYCGCPYTAGVDIFPMDGIYDDPEKEQDRIDRARLARKALDMVMTGSKDTSECRMILNRIESQVGIRLPKGDRLGHALSELISQIYSECPTDSASHVAYMKGWVAGGLYRHDKAWFDETIYLPFEHIEIPAPMEYDKVLHVEYGDYMQINRGGGVAHSYPVYRMQQDILTKHLASHPDERLSAYIASTADRHVEHDASSKEILDMCDQVIAMIQTKAVGDEASCKALLQGMVKLFDSLAGMLSEDYTTEATAIKRIGYIKEMIEGYIEDDIPDADGPDRGNHMTGEEASRGSTDYNECASKLSAGLSRLRDEITELYRGRGPIATGEPVDA